MADIKISEMTTAATLNGTEVSVLSQSQGGQLVSVKATLQAIANWFAVNAEYTSALNTTDKRICGAINELKQLISLIPQFSIEVVETLPTEDISDTTIYLVPAEDPETGNYYEEYIYVNNAWELVGTTAVDLSDYYTKAQADGKFAVTITNTISPTTTTKKVADIKQNNVTTPVYADDADAILRQAFGEHTVEGNPVSFDAFLGLEVAKSAELTLNPIQDLHGYDNPWVGGAGKNKVNAEIKGQTTVSGITGECFADNRFVLSGTSTGNGDFVTNCTPFTIPSGTTYTISIHGDLTLSSNAMFLYYGGKNTNFTASAKARTVTATEDITISNLRFRCFTAVTVSADFKLQIEFNSTATSYAPYSNICPISGRTQAEITVADAETSPTQTQTYTLTFGQTIYGGKVDAVSGKLTDEWAEIASYAGETITEPWLSDRDEYTAGGTPTTGAQVVYKKATATTSFITPTDIDLLKGTNVISTDCDGLKVVYSADIKAYIDSRLT